MSKLGIYHTIKEKISDKVLLCGSTALEIMGFDVNSNPLDLDVVIFTKDLDFQEKLEIQKKLELLSEMSGKDIYKGTNEELGQKFFIESPIEGGKVMHVHVFVSSTLLHDRVLSTIIDGKEVGLVTPINIIRAKQKMNRSKDSNQIVALIKSILG